MCVSVSAHQTLESMMHNCVCVFEKERKTNDDDTCGCPHIVACVCERGRKIK